MGNIINKLNLNKNPQGVEDNTIIFAKNIKLLKDNSISRDDGCLSINFNISDVRNQANIAKQNYLNIYTRSEEHTSELQSQL